MMVLRFLFLFCLFFMVFAAAFGDDVIPFEQPFPMERLAELRFALDAARGDVDVVDSRLARGENPDTVGEVELIYSINGENLRIVHEALTGNVDIDWREGIWLHRNDGLYLLLYQGMSMYRVLYALGFDEMSMFFFGNWDTWHDVTIAISNDKEWMIKEDSMFLRTPDGIFEFSNFTRELQGWSSVEGIEMNVAVYEGDQLSLIAAATDLKSEVINLILKGVPYFNPLYCAAAYNRVEVIQTLLAGGADPAPRFSDGLTALHAAASWSCIEATAALLDAGLEIDSQTDESVTPLMAAIDGPSRKRAVLTLDLSTTPKKGILNLERIFFPVVSSEPGKDLDFTTAEIEGKEETALYLLNRGADPAQQKADGETVLFSAARHGMLVTMDRMLEGGLDPEIQDNNGETALFAAIRENRPDSLDLLIRKGAEWNGKNRDGKSPMDIAKSMRTRYCVGILEWRKPFHWSLAAAINLSSSTVDGYGSAPGVGGYLNLHFRPMRFLWITTELGYTLQGSEADLDDPWLISTFGSPYYEYQHIDVACLFDFALYRTWSWRISGIVGTGFNIPISTVIRTDSDDWDPIDVTDQLGNMGLELIFGAGINGFAYGGMLIGLEIRYTRTVIGEWTSQGGGLSSWELLVRFGS